MATRWLEFVTSPWLGGAARHGMTCGASGAPEPGGGHHSVTEGFLVGEVVRRVTGQSLATFFADQVARPLGADFHITLPPDTTTASPPAAARRPETAVAGTGIRLSDGNSVAWRRAEIPSAAGYGNARSVAAVRSVLACGGDYRGLGIVLAA
jgi:CubicO group peptidase (beta-lactamase class C family)